MNVTVTNMQPTAFRINNLNHIGLMPAPSRLADVNVPKLPAKAKEPQSKLKPKTKADAPLSKLGRMFTAGVHLAVLIGLVVFVVSQLALAFSADKREAIVTIVASNLSQVTVPMDGVFTAIRHMPKGTRVSQGEVLGHISSVSYDAEIENAQLELNGLRQQRLTLRGVRSNTPNRELASVSQKISFLKSKLNSLRQSSQNMCIISPVDGTIEQGFSGSQSVHRNDTVVKVWEATDELLVEVKAPLNEIQRLLKKGIVTAHFTTPEGSAVVVSATPIQDSLKHIEKDAEGHAEIWGSIQCRTNSLPSEVAAPGFMGRL